MTVTSILATLARWPFDPAVLTGIVISAVLYWRGAGYMRAHGLGRHLRRWRESLFALGLVVLFFTLNSPLDDWADQYLWAHMAQHELLALVVAPLLLFGEPLMIMWRGLPLGGRRAIATWAVRTSWPVRLFETIERFLRRPVVSWLTFVILFSVWHLPTLYDLATEHAAIHAFEHVCFIFGGLVFWSQMIPSLPFKPNARPLAQSLYFALAAMWGNVLGWAFMFSTTPSYPYYVRLARTPDMISAITDQHIAGGVMDAADTAIFIACIIIALGLWLRDVERESEADGAQIATPLPVTASPSAPSP
ncbi:MAG TPA: cytochrome c oxidase assembly protein [Ktedonobacterales bacterium]